MSTIRRHLGLLSFKSLVKYFDVTLLQRIIISGQPYHIAKYIQSSHVRSTRAATNEILRSNFNPKNAKSSRSFVVRALKSYNSLPIEIRKLSGHSFNKAVKEYYYEKENQEPTTCTVS